MRSIRYTHVSRNRVVKSSAITSLDNVPDYLRFLQLTKKGFALREIVEIRNGKV